MDPLTSIGPRVAHAQTFQQRTDEVRNDAGGYVFALDDLARARRFLILGSAGGTYYATQRKLTEDNAEVIIRLAAAPDTGPVLVDLITEVSDSGAAPRQQPTIFALAVCCASPDDATRARAMAAIARVCRTGTHLFAFAGYVEQFRGWGRGLRRAVARWYTEPPVRRVAYQAVKYRQRDGWSHRDVLRLCHPDLASDATGPRAARRALFDWICRPEGAVAAVGGDDLDVVVGYQAALAATDPGTWAQLVASHGLPWEALPDAALNETAVWEALLPRIGLTALIRQLGRLTRLGVVAPFSSGAALVADRLRDEEALASARVHPLAVLTALVTYQQGHGLRGDLTWTPVPAIVEALDDAFYLAFGTIRPAGKRTLIGLDVSGSMRWGTVAGSPLRPVTAEAAMAMTVVRTEPEYFTMAFSGGFVPLALTPRQRLDDVVGAMANMPFDRTDCAQPMLWATEHRVAVDTFVVYTDNETWAGSVHPFDALRRYRDRMGIPARLAVVGMTSTGFSIADPTDAGMLDLVGFDGATPELLAGFSRGEL